MTKGVIIMTLILSMITDISPAQERPAYNAGAFYPANPAEITSLITAYLKNAGAKTLPQKPFGIIVPHAGYIYSGPVAAYAYREVKDQEYDAVIVLAPCHVEYFPFAAIYPGDAYLTPLGKVAVDKKLAAQCVTADKLVKLATEGHLSQRFGRAEHSLEVQLPFLQIVLPNTPIVPIVIGTHDWRVLESLGKRLGELLVQKNILIVASSDFSHYHSYSECQKIDQRAIECLKQLDAVKFYQGFTSETFEACGGAPITALLIAAQKMKNPQIEILKSANSGDVPHGDKSAVVGYVAVGLYQGISAKSEDKNPTASQLNTGDLTREEQLYLLDLAEKTVAAAVNHRPLPDPKDVPERLKVKRGAFVTLEKHHELRGCIGYILPIYPLYKTVIEMAKAAALDDPRFPPVSPSELKDITVEISVLTVPQKISDPSEIEVGKHGIIIKRGFNQGLLLPQVATDYGWDRETFLEHTCLKAGLPRDAWQDKNTEIQIFSAQVFNRETVK